MEDNAVECIGEIKHSKKKGKISLEEVNIVEENETLSWEIDESGEKEEVLQEEEIEYERKAMSNEFDVPNYKSDFTGYLMEKEFSTETGKHIANDSCLPKKTCFNCLGDHNINECKEKKDFQAIARNRKTIFGKRGSNLRYHEESENKFPDMKPGKISENLRNAMNLRSNQAPEFIYRMRVLGYPPGWLKEAEVKRAEVSLFDGSGNPTIHPDEEEGETDVNLTKYQPEKLVTYPGFNAPFPDHIRDEHQYWNYPPLQEHHSKDNFLRFMNMNKVTKYKKKKLKPKKDQVNVNKLHGDMEVEDLESSESHIEFNPPLPEDSPVRPPEPPPLPPLPEVLEEGEVLEDSSTDKDYDEKENTLNSSDKEEDSKTDSQMSEDSSISQSEDSGSKSRVKRHHASTSKGFTLGVCVPNSENPYNDLPEPDKWSVDVSDHILFENLPDALGTWQKMKGVMKNVQTALENLRDSE